MTLVEAPLLRMAKGPTDKDDARPILKQLIQRLRGAKLQERQVLLVAVYKWAFGVVAGR